LKTTGSGKIFIRRKGKLGLLIEGDATASGPVEEEDYFIFLTENFLNLIAGSQGLEEVFDHRSPSEIIEEITPSLKAKNDQGAAALYVDFHQENEDDSLYFREQEEKISFGATVKSYWQMMRNSKKTLTFITALILFLVLLWSVVLGYQRRTSAGARNKIKLARELIGQKLSTAEEVEYLNIDRALILLSESKEELEKLRKEIGNKRKEVGELEAMIQTTENKILKKDMKKYSEFYDLTLDDKNATGNRIYLDGDMAFILDNKRGAVYRFSLTKKSLDKNLMAEIKSAGLAAGYEEETFFFVKGSGVYRIDSDSKLKKVIDNSKNWGEINDMYIYNGNIYLMDKGKDEIWKYLRSDNGYGEGISYFERGQAIDFSLINSLAIDGSIYLAGDSIIIKYTSGLRDGFRVDLPVSKTNYTKVYTSKDLEKIYLWDKSKGTIFVIGKTGEYQEQINSDILSKGNDIIVYKDIVYILHGSKIYRID